MIALLCLSPLGAFGQTPGLTVTTDSAAYCAELAARLAASPGGDRPSARDLGAEGQQLCDTGHVRTGIARLRRALRAARTPS